MNHDLIIKYTNRIAVYTTFALFYWLLIFLTITIFDLKIFRERITESFYLSVLAIFAILGASIILNVMSNLSKISSSVGTVSTTQSEEKFSKKTVALIASIPIVFALLFLGDYYSANKKKQMLIASSETMVLENQKELSILSKYNFSPEYIKQASGILSVMEKIDKNFPDVKIIMPDTIGEKEVFLSFRNSSRSETEEFHKQDFIYSASKEDREYLKSVFSAKEIAIKFSAKKGNYELYYPTKINGKIMILYLSDYQNYGKYGS